jgi:hypothetical protein
MKEYDPLAVETAKRKPLNRRTSGDSRMSTDESGAANASSTTSTWYETASDAVKSGMSDAQKSAEKALPKIGEYLSKGLYHLGYGIGYGVTFPSVLIARSIPQENCVTWGFVDGANVAYETVHREKTEPTAGA